MYSLYDIISELCKNKGITPGKMCKEIGISRGLITDLKMGRKHNATGATLKKIADYLNVSVDYLLTGNSKDEDFSDIEIITKLLNNNPDLKTLLEKLSDVSTSDIQKIIHMLDNIKSEKI